MSFVQAYPNDKFTINILPDLAKDEGLRTAEHIQRASVQQFADKLYGGKLNAGRAICIARAILDNNVFPVPRLDLFENIHSGEVGSLGSDGFPTAAQRFIICPLFGRSLGADRC